jgi:hypothetical protein
MAPRNLIATSAGSSTIDLSWEDHSDDENGFTIERKIGAEGSYEEIATVGENVTSYSNTDLTAGTTYFYRVRAYNSEGNSTYSNEASATTTVPGNGPILIPKNSIWKYEASGTDLGTAWKQVNYNDGNWSSGNGILGFGESYINTTLPTGKMTYYFRRTFTLTDDPSTVSQLTLLANYDDGFVAYLNGQEVVRRSMPTGTVTYGTPAISHEGGVYETIDLTAHLDKLAMGTNVLAVEVHQHDIASTDVVMDMELQGQQAASAAGAVLAKAIFKEQELPSLPSRIVLYKNYPNPFNPSTVMRFSLPEDAYVTLKVYNVVGEEVETLVDDWRAAGIHSVIFWPKQLASGTYLYVMQAGQVRLMRKCSFMK